MGFKFITEEGGGPKHSGMFKVIDTETGKTVNNVTSVSINIEVDSLVTAEMTVFAEGLNIELPKECVCIKCINLKDDRDKALEEKARDGIKAFKELLVGHFFLKRQIKRILK